MLHCHWSSHRLRSSQVRPKYSERHHHSKAALCARFMYAGSNNQGSCSLVRRGPMVKSRTVGGWSSRAKERSRTSKLGSCAYRYAPTFAMSCSLYVSMSAVMTPAVIRAYPSRCCRPRRLPPPRSRPGRCRCRRDAPRLVPSGSPQGLRRCPCCRWPRRQKGRF